MDDIQAQMAYDAYCEILQRYRTPSIAPELLQVMNNLCDAASYFDLIPINKITPEQKCLSAKINALLMRD